MRPGSPEYHLRAAHAMHTKVQRICHMPETPQALPEILDNYYQNVAAELPHNFEWKKRLHKALGPQATPEAEAAITAEACAYVHRYLEAFLLHHEATHYYTAAHIADRANDRNSTNPFYLDTHNRLEDLTELSTNHIANAAQAFFLKYTDVEHALSLHKYVVSKALAGWGKTDYYAAHVKPFLDHGSDAEANVQNVRDYARNARLHLLLEYDQERGKSFAERLRQEKATGPSNGTSLS